MGSKTDLSFHVQFDPSTTQQRSLKILTRTYWLKCLKWRKFYPQTYPLNSNYRIGHTFPTPHIPSYKIRRTNPKESTNQEKLQQFHRRRSLCHSKIRPQYAHSVAWEARGNDATAHGNGAAKEDKEEESAAWNGKQERFQERATERAQEAEAAGWGNDGATERAQVEEVRWSDAMAAGSLQLWKCCSSKQWETGEMKESQKEKKGFCEECASRIVTWNEL